MRLTKSSQFNTKFFVYFLFQLTRAVTVIIIVSTLRISISNVSPNFCVRTTSKKNRKYVVDINFEIYEHENMFDSGD